MNTHNEPPPVHCSFRELRDPTALIPHPRNPNRHSDRQIELLSRIIQHQGWRNPIVVSSRSGFIIAGHGRLAAALRLGLEAVPVDVQDFASEADEWAHLVADNRIAELAEMDRETLGGLLSELGEIEGFEVELAGFTDAEVDRLLGEDAAADDISDDADSSEAACLLKFDGLSIPLAESERAEFRRRIDQHAELTGSYFGVMRAILGLDEEEEEDDV